MAVKRYVGDRFVGISSDTKPAGVTDGALFIESDTKRMFLLVSGVWGQVVGSGDTNSGTGTDAFYSEVMN